MILLADDANQFLLNTITIIIAFFKCRAYFASCLAEEQHRSAAEIFFQAAPPKPFEHIFSLSSLRERKLQLLLGDIR